MNSTLDKPDCMFFSFVEFHTLFELDSFSYVSKAVAVINCVSSPVSAVGNALVLMVIITNSSLRTPANVFIGSLAVVDFMIGAVVQPMFTAIVTVKTGLYHDCIYRDSLFFIGILLTTASILLMAAVSCERYAALFFHLRYNTLITNSKALTIVLIIWAASIFIALLASFGDIFLVFSQILVCLLWVISLFAIGVSYFNILRLVRRHHRQIQSQQAAVSTDPTTVSPLQTKLAITMGYVIGLSFLFFIPTAITFQIFTSTRTSSSLVFNSFVLTMAIQFTSSGFNPVFYCWKTPAIRESIIATLRKVQCFLKP